MVIDINAVPCLKEHHVGNCGEDSSVPLFCLSCVLLCEFTVRNVQSYAPHSDHPGVSIKDRTQMVFDPSEISVLCLPPELADPVLTCFDDGLALALRSF